MMIWMVTEKAGTPWYRKTMKGWILDHLFIFVVFVLIVAVFLFVMQDVSTQFQAAMANSIIGQNPQVLATTASIGHTLSIFNYMLPFLVYGLCIGVLILAAMLEANPLVLGLGFVWYLFAIWISFPLSNVFHAIVANPALIASAGMYPEILWMIAEMPVELAIFMGAYLVVVTLKFWRKRGVSYT